MLGLTTSLSSEHFHFDAGTNVVFAAVDDPCDRRDNEDNTERSDTVVCLGSVLTLQAAEDEEGGTYSCCCR